MRAFLSTDPSVLISTFDHNEIDRVPKRALYSAEISEFSFGYCYKQKEQLSQLKNHC